MNILQLMVKQRFAATSNAIRAVFDGGYSSTSSNYADPTIDYVTIATPGNAVDFGDMVYYGYGTAAASGD